MGRVGSASTPQQYWLSGACQTPLALPYDGGVTNSGDQTPDPSEGPLDPFADHPDPTLSGAAPADGSDTGSGDRGSSETGLSDGDDGDSSASKASGDAGAGTSGSSAAGDAGNPFGGAGLPFFGDLSKLMGGQPGTDFAAARQMAIAVASGGESEPNVDPAERIKWEQLARVAELQVEAVVPMSTSISGRGITISTVTRTQWVQQSLDAYEPLFVTIGDSLNSGDDPADEPDPADAMGGDPMAAMMAPLMKAITPMILSMTTGSMIGHLGATSFGQYDLPVPREPDDTLLVVPANVEVFAEEWSLPRDDLRLWICIHEVAWHSVLGVPFVRDRITELLTAFTGGFKPDPNALTNRMESMDISAFTGGGDPMSAIQDLFSDPEILLGATRTPAQDRTLEEFDALLSVLVGYVDFVIREVGSKLLASHEMITEALERRRVTAGPSDRYVEKLLGMELDQGCYDDGEAFVAGVVARSGAEGLNRLWRKVENLPTPAELVAPGLWLARIDLPEELEEPGASQDAEEPDSGEPEAG